MSIYLTPVRQIEIAQRIFDLVISINSLSSIRSSHAKMTHCFLSTLAITYSPPRRRSPPRNDAEAREIERLRAELDRQRAETAELRGHFAALIAHMQRKKIETFEDLAKKDKEAKQEIIELAAQTAPAKLDGFNVALFGLTSTGKSTMLNALLGQEVAETGVGETTTKIKAYPGNRFTLWDIPGRNDEVSYLSMEYVSFFKGLSRRLILIQATVKENSSMMKLLDELKLDYDIVFNKFDLVPDHKQKQVKEQINKEIESLGLQKARKVYFVSAENPKMFDDWLAMVNHLTG